MSEITLQTARTFGDYPEGIQKLFLDIKEEVESGLKDGIGMRLASQKGEASEVYGFLKDQGYDITYKDFNIFYEDSLKIIEDNETALERMMEEQSTQELSDNDLEQVAGGSGWWKKNWKKVAIGAGAVLVVAAVTVMTCGVAGVAAAGAAASMTGMGALAPAIATASVTGYVSAGMAAVGIGAIAAGTTE